MIDDPRNLHTTEHRFGANEKKILCLRGRRGVVVGFQLYSPIMSLLLFVGKYITIDFVFSSVVRRYVLKLAQAASYKEALIARKFRIDVRYNVDIRYWRSIFPVTSTC